MILIALFVMIVSLQSCTPQAASVMWIKYYFPGNSAKAIRVATCESSLNPNAVSPGGGNAGLFQENVSAHRLDFQRVTGKPFYPYVFDPKINTMYAAYLYRQQGWEPWSCRNA